MSAPTERPRLELDREQGEARLSLDAGLYPLPAILSACDVFLDHCWLVIERPDPSRYVVVLTPKTPRTPDELRGTAGELANELLCCAYRHTLTREHRAAIEAIAVQAISGAMGPPSLEDLASFDFTEESFEDPLGIALPHRATQGEGDT
jgi:His-Xaa-Ser system protein HxsD